jgi:hypothetical protein
VGDCELWASIARVADDCQAPMNTAAEENRRATKTLTNDDVIVPVIDIWDRDGDLSIGQVKPTCQWVIYPRRAMYERRGLKKHMRKLIHGPTSRFSPPAPSGDSNPKRRVPLGFVTCAGRVDVSLYRMRYEPFPFRPGTNKIRCS